jgi:hemoglobin
MKTDIKNRADIEILVNAFYEKIKLDAGISYFFTDVVKVKWEDHLPKMYSFFENILFSTGDYDGNPMVTHEELHKKSVVTQEHFAYWNELFVKTVDELFSGEKAEEIKLRAINISKEMSNKALG